MFALIKRFKRFDESGNIEAKDALLFFSLLKCATHEFEAYNFSYFLKKWRNLVDCGGLIKVNDKFFLFSKYVEMLVRKTLTFSFMKTYKGGDICELLHKKLEESNRMNNLWERLTRYVQLNN